MRAQLQVATIRKGPRDQQSEARWRARRRLYGTPFLPGSHMGKWSDNLLRRTCSVNKLQGSLGPLRQDGVEAKGWGARYQNPIKPVILCIFMQLGCFLG